MDVVYPDWLIALWKRPFAFFEASKLSTLCPPADYPNIVTLSGLPPNKDILDLTHSKAAIISNVPKFEDLSSSFCNAWIEGCVNHPMALTCN